MVHPTADYIYEVLKKELPSISLATVYRNLNQLAANGIIRRLDRLDDVVVNDLIAMIDRNPGKTNLYFNIIDINTHTKVKVHSRAKKVKVERSLLEFIKKSDAFEYKIN